MKKSELREIIREEIRLMREVNIKSQKWRKPESYEWDYTKKEHSDFKNLNAKDVLRLGGNFVHVYYVPTKKTVYVFPLNNKGKPEVHTKIFTDSKARTIALDAEEKYK